MSETPAMLEVSTRDTLASRLCWLRCMSRMGVPPLKRWLDGSVQQLHGIQPRRHGHHRTKHLERRDITLSYLSGVDGLKVAGGVLNKNDNSVWECKNHAANDSDCPQPVL